MIDKVAYEISKYMADNVTWFDKWAGLVMPMRKKVQTADKVFPVAINTPSSCDQSDYTALVPDSAKKAITYIEKLGDTEVEVFHSHYKQLSNKLRLVVWYNLDRITEGEYISPDVLIDEVWDALPKRLSDALFTGVKQVHLIPTGVVTGSEIVSQYTYNEIKTQFSIHPYGIFAIDFEVFYIATHCSRGINPSAGCETGKGNHLNYQPNPQ